MKTKIDSPLRSSRLPRRRFLAGATQAALATGLAAPLVSLSGCRAPRAPNAPRKRVAILATEVRKHSHAQHFIDRFVEGYGWQGHHHRPPMDLVSLYVDQFPAGDLSRDRARRRGVRIFPTIAEALTLGGPSLAVDGVLIIAEHGKYPRNEKGQTLYPRFRFFRETVAVFEASGRSVPVFNDKHLSTDWGECTAMMRDARRLGFPFLAGSSLPVTWRMPMLEFEPDTPLIESVCVCYGGVDSYDFHGLETAQCMSERRAGGESGVKSVLAVRGERVWAEIERRDTTRRLVLAALTRHFTGAAEAHYTFAVPTLDWARRHCREPVGYFYEHRDGFRTAMFLMNGVVSDFLYAGLRGDNGRIESCQMFLPMPSQIATTADFFNPLVNNIERMILENAAPYPAERTWLTSGMTLFAIESLHRGQVELPTPELNVAYGPTRASTYWRS
ncbi:MAG TPA: hypothetical protein VNO52_11010 [Methylomirabilota bacterium]|nr:hypothetical protein [Methylomirabilota bacterium]